MAELKNSACCAGIRAKNNIIDHKIKQMINRKPKPISWAELLKYVVTAAATWVITNYSS